MNIIEDIKKTFRKEQKEVISCQFGYRRLSFFDKKVSFCSNGNPSNMRAYPIIYDNFEGNIDIEDLAKKINTVRKNASKGENPKSCIGCNLIKDKYVYNKKKYPELDFIEFADYSLCNSKCIYCNSWKSTKIDGNNISTINGCPDSYEILPIIKKLIKKSMITKDTIISFAGGEPTVYRQFEEILDFLINTGGIKHIEIFSNAIKYSEWINIGLSKGIINLTVSIDAGKKETHKIIKGVNSYDTVYSNIEKYVKSEKNPGQVILKYVLVPEYNDSEEEISLWIEKSKKVGVKSIIINADNRIFETEYKKEEMVRLNKFIEFFENKAKESNINYDIASNCRFIQKQATE